jgi:hypothetical protein
MSETPWSAKESGHDSEKCKTPASCTCRCEGCMRYHRYDGYSGVHLVDVAIAAGIGSAIVGTAIAIIFGIVKLL